jgi:acetyl-CoA C-acetyltransferase
MVREVVLVSAVRTAVGDFGGSLKDVPPSVLASMVVAEAMARARLEDGAAGYVVFGNVIHTEPKDMYLARVAGVNGGAGQGVPALTLNRLCGSGLQAIVTAAQMIALGEIDIAVAGGAESMSRALFGSSTQRFGMRLGDTRLTDMLVGALTDPFDNVHMGMTAENVACRYGISREEQDELALESHRRAARAQREGRFKEQILAVPVRTKKGTVQFDTDEHVRADITAEDLSRLKPVFSGDAGTVTAGNASGINDAAAALVIMERSVAEARGLRPLARLVSSAHSGVEPAYMGIGPVPASRLALEKAGLCIEDMDFVEANEAFAAQACAVARELRIPFEKLNPNGSGISLGHPIGATGSILAVKAVYELERSCGRYALLTMCIGGGQGIAAIFEKI